LLTMKAEEAMKVNYYATPQKFNAPLKINLRAMTDGNDIRIRYGSGRLILNLHNKPDDLQLICINNGKSSGIKANGQLPTNEFVDIEWFIGKKVMGVKVNGELRHISDNYAYIKEFSDTPNYQPCEQVLICSAYNSTVTVKSLQITEI